MTYGIVILVSLFLIFFVGKELDPVTNTEGFVITSDGINHFSKWMDIAGWVSLTYKIDLSKYRQIYTDEQEFFQVTKWIKDIILQNIDKRISALGVSDYTSYIQSLDDGEYVVVEIWWVSDLDQAKEIIGKTVELEFKLPFEWDITKQKASRQLLAEDILKQTVADPTLMTSLAQKYAGDNVVYHTYSGVARAELPGIYQSNPELLSDREIGSVIPTLAEWAYGNDVLMAGWQLTATTSKWFVITKYNGTTTTTTSGWVTNTQYSLEDLVVDFRPARVPAIDPKTWDLLNGAFFKFAGVGSSQTGQPVATINFDEKGKQVFCNITEVIVGKQLAIFIWGELVTSPVIREKICGGGAQIDGSFTPATAKALVDSLNEWALPAELILSQEEKVSPVLWEKALTGSLIAAGVWLLLIYGFMIWMYGFRQWSVAILTLISFIIVLLWVTKIFKYAFSLSGIAAILLSLGMGVDANVLIYERVREERKKWLTRSEAISEWYEKSYSAIRDGNVTTLMIAILLFFVGTNVFKWFGTMMMVNIILTLLVIVPLTKRLLMWFYRND